MCVVRGFLSAARDGLISCQATDPSMVSPLCVLAPLLSALQQLIVDTGFLNIVDAYSFDAL